MENRQTLVRVPEVLDGLRLTRDGSKGDPAGACGEPSSSSCRAGGAGDYRIKGNISQKGTRIYHVLGCRRRRSSCALSSRLTDAPRPTPHMRVTLLAIVQQRSGHFRAVANPRMIHLGTVMSMRR